MIAGLQARSIAKLRSMPYELTFAICRVMAFVAAVLRRRDGPPQSRSTMRMIGRPFDTRDASARRELGYIVRTSPADGLRPYQEAFGVPD